MQERQIPIYLIHPYRGKGRPGEYAENLQKTIDIAQEIQAALPQVLVISPVLALGPINDENLHPKIREQALIKCKNLMEIVYLAGGEAWAFGDVANSKGCGMEMHHAGALGMRLRIDPDPWALETIQCYDHAWVHLGETTPSGKILYRCAKCGITDTVPVKPKHEDRPCRPVIMTVKEVEQCRASAEGAAQ